MAIVHPAFCGITVDPMEPISAAGIPLCVAAPGGYKTLQKPRVQPEKP